MPRLRSQEELREEFSRRLGKPKNDVDKHIYGQLFGLTGKSVIIQYGLHLGENPGRLAAMLARKELGSHPDVGFLEFQGVFDFHRDALIGRRAAKLSGYRLKPADCINAQQMLRMGKSVLKIRGMKKHLRDATRELVRENKIPSYCFDRDSIEAVVFCVFRPEHYIDVHASALKIDKKPIEEPFMLLTSDKEHERVVRRAFPKVLVGTHEALKWKRIPIHVAIEVGGKQEPVRRSSRTTKSVADFYRLSPGDYKKALRLDEQGVRNARLASDFLVKFVNKLLRMRA
jgi:hypothetical protein